MRFLAKNALRLALPMIALIAAAPVQAKEDLSNWQLPSVPVPKDNPQSAAKDALGKQLACDVRLSKNDSMA